MCQLVYIYNIFESRAFPFSQVIKTTHSKYIRNRLQEFPKGGSIRKPILQNGQFIEIECNKIRMAKNRNEKIEKPCGKTT